MSRETTLKPQRSPSNFSNKPEHLAGLLKLHYTLSYLINFPSPQTLSLPDFSKHEVDKATSDQSWPKIKQKDCSHFISKFACSLVLQSINSTRQIILHSKLLAPSGKFQWCWYLFPERLTSLVWCPDQRCLPLKLWKTGQLQTSLPAGK